MAIFIKNCAICGDAITGNTPYVATSGCAFDPSHALFSYCDTGLHQACLATWEHRKPFAAAYCEPRGTCVLATGEKWKLYCGPLTGLPYGKVAKPYYAEVRLREWPIRLYSRFEEWDGFIGKKAWERNYIAEINADIAGLVHEFPASTDRLDELLLPHVIAMIENSPDHRSRYLTVLALDLFGEKARVAIPTLKAALQDDHGSVRQAAHILLKRWRA